MSTGTLPPFLPPKHRSVRVHGEFLRAPGGALALDWLCDDCLGAQAFSSAPPTSSPRSPRCIRRPRCLGSGLPREAEGGGERGLAIPPLCQELGLLCEEASGGSALAWKTLVCKDTPPGGRTLLGLLSVPRRAFKDFYSFRTIFFIPALARLCCYFKALLICEDSLLFGEHSHFRLKP